LILCWHKSSKTTAYEQIALHVLVSIPKAVLKITRKGEKVLQPILLHLALYPADWLTAAFLLSQSEHYCSYFKHLPISIVGGK
jgi:hypothetical protein